MQNYCKTRLNYIIRKGLNLIPTVRYLVTQASSLGENPDR